MEEKKKVGRPKIEINEDQLEKLSSLLCTMEEMASFFGCSVDTLERNFADTIKESYSEKLTKGVITNNEQKGNE